MTLLHRCFYLNFTIVNYRETITFSAMGTHNERKYWGGRALWQEWGGYKGWGGWIKIGGEQSRSKLWMLGENLNVGWNQILHLSCFIQHALSNIKCSFIEHYKMEDLATIVVLNELVDSDDEKPTRGKNRKWIKRRKERGFLQALFKSLCWR